MAGDSRYGFEQSWEPCWGTWWYEHAAEEGVLIEEKGENNRGTGHFLHPLSRVEKDEIAERYLAPYRAMSAETLLGHIGREVVSTGEGRHGTPFAVTVSVGESYLSDDLWVHVEVDDCLGWHSGGGWAELYRQLPVSEMCNWCKEGF